MLLMKDVVREGRSGILVVDSWVNTLENWSCKMFALSWSSNFSDSASLGFASRGAIPLFVFILLRVYAQKHFGFRLHRNEIPFSKILFAFLSIPLTLFRAFAYLVCAFSLSSFDMEEIHARRLRFFSLIAFLAHSSIGKLPFSLHDGLLDMVVLGTN